MSIEIAYRPEFVRQYSKLDKDLQLEVREKIELFKDRNNHKILKVHKLHGRLAHRLSFSVNYKYRIVFEYLTDNEVALKTIGDHDIYK
jgi:mRNA-degrading endonuclease YafQ of YafQ-DinJ toxin-antitoxin module